MISQHLELDGDYPDGVWVCPGCRTRLRDGRLQHPANCPELRNRRRDLGSLPFPAPADRLNQAHRQLTEAGML